VKSSSRAASMRRVQIAKPQYSSEGDSAVHSAEIMVGAQRHSVWYRTSAPVTGDVEPFLVASLFAAMRTGLPLHTDEPVSPLLLDNLQQIQEIFHGWDRSLSIVPVEAPAKQDKDVLASGIGCFFSGGVDSFYSTLKHSGKITALIFVHGFDIPLNAASLRATARESLRGAAAQLGLPLLEIETNLRSLADQYLHWGFSHGAALASIALILSSHLGRVYIPASFTYADLFPWGSHPLVDPLWSTERVTLVHDGCEATRVEKIASVARHEVALRHLRVCCENQGNTYNCCKCEKCLRTMIGLRLAGALDHCTTFDQPLSPLAVARMRIRTVGARNYLEENLNALETSGRDPELAQALRDCLNNQASFQASEEQWELSIPLAKSELAHFVQEGECLILVDECLLGEELVANRKVLPFTERDGQYWGVPTDDASAIAELERLRCAGASFFVVAWPAFWWLEYYAGLQQHLCARYPCLLQNERLVVFDLSGHLTLAPSGAACAVAEV
jgi:hypothetical protein